MAKNRFSGTDFDQFLAEEGILQEVEEATAKVEMTTIIRLTRHEASETQSAELTRIFGEVEVTQVSESLPTDSREAVTRFDEIATDATVVEAVLPINLIEAVLKFSEFSKRGGVIIRAITIRELDEEENSVFTFSHYEKIVKVETVTERL